jgi:hypothetical protein
VASTERLTTAGQWVSTTAPLNTKAATIGRVARRTNAMPRPSPITSRASQVGVASNAMAGTKYDSSMCWSMCAL